MASSTIYTLTEALFSQTGRLLRYSTPVASNQGLSITFDFYQYGGTGGDGISFFLVDGSQKLERPGGFGGSLGYAPLQIDATTTRPGITGGYIGVGLDAFGNYSDATGGRTGGVGSRPDSVVVRGSAATNYAYLDGVSLPVSLDNEAPDATRANSKRTAKVDLSPAGDLSVKIDLNADGDFLDAGENVISNLNVIQSGNGPLPASFIFGFSASTGGDTNVHEVGNFRITTFDGRAIPGNFDGELVIDVPPTETTPNRQEGGSGNDFIQTGGGADTINGKAGNDVLVGNPGSDRLTGGTEADVFYFRGATKSQALRNSTLRAIDRISDFKFAEGDKFGLDFDNNLTTIERPKRLFYAGKEQGGLIKAARSAYADKNQKRRGNQALRADEAVFFKRGSRTYLSVNDSKAGFSAANDLLVDVTGIQHKAGDLKKGGLAVADYFLI
jgi:serralysin